MYEYELIKAALVKRGFDVASDKKVANICGISERKVREYRLGGFVDEYDVDEMLVGAGLMPQDAIPTWYEDGKFAADIAEGLVDINAI